MPRTKEEIQQEYNQTVLQLGQKIHQKDMLQYGIDCDRRRLKEIQIEAKALRKLRHPSRAKKLKAFIDS